MDTAEAGPRRPPGYYGKEQREARAAEYQARRAKAELERQFKTIRDRPMMALRQSATKRLAQVMRDFDESREQAEPRQDPLTIARRMAVLEQARVAKLIDRDRVSRKRENRRTAAREELEAGVFANINDAVMEPTPEQLLHGSYVAYTPDKLAGTARAPQTVRNLAVDRIGLLLRREVIDRDLWKALTWYRERYELSGLSPSMTANYGESVGGTPAYGMMPKTPAQIEARSDYRWARDQIPVDVIALFEAVVLHDRSLADERRGSDGKPGVRYANIRAAFIRAALILFEAIKSELKIGD